MARLLVLIVIMSITGLCMATSSYTEKDKEITKLIREKRFDEVEDYLDALSENGDEKEIYKAYKHVEVTLEQECEFEIALEFTNKYISKYPYYKGGQSLYQTQGWLLSDLNRFKLAIESLERFLINFKGSIYEDLTRWRLGQLYLRTQEYEKAEYNLKWFMEKNQRIQPYDYVSGELDLIDVYLAWGKMDDAKKLSDEGIKKYGKENENKETYEFKYRVKLAKYFFIQKDWKDYLTVNRLPIPFYQKIAWGGLISKLEKMDHVYKYRENKDFADMYTNHLLWKHKGTVSAKIDENKLNNEQKLALQTMRGIAYYWLDEKDRAKKYLLEANRKGNFLLDEASYYAALIEFENGNYLEAEKQLKNYRSLFISDVPEGVQLGRRIDTKLGKLKYFGEK